MTREKPIKRKRKLSAFEGNQVMPFSFCHCGFLVFPVPYLLYVYSRRGLVPHVLDLRRSTYYNKHVTGTYVPVPYILGGGPGGGGGDLVRRQTSANSAVASEKAHVARVVVVAIVIPYLITLASSHTVIHLVDGVSCS